MHPFEAAPVTQRGTDSGNAIELRRMADGYACDPRQGERCGGGRVVVDEHRGADVAELPREFVGREPRVERHDDGGGTRRRVHQLDEAHAVRQQQRDAIAHVRATRDETARDGIDSVVECGERRFAAGGDDRRPKRCQRRARAQPVPFEGAYVNHTQTVRVGPVRY